MITQTTSPSSTTIALWKALLVTGQSLTGRIGTELKNAGLPPLAWYDVLWEVEKCGDAGIRPMDLRGRLLLPQYGLSRLLDRLYREGLVEKLPVSEDGRGHVVRLTEAGHEMRSRMWQVYGDALSQMIELQVEEGDMVHLTEILRQLAER
ncbi:MarR family winged helix-turn-helix transcriptional regulator [Pseudooceanicola sp. C21-150M6]|uniref:MarR family winged helix-turn-helix transcriptional regulator n=1 Tax=Pseudooceanicola sp. C21-150M6 TaxID=3434355 RepID=UPI003D7F77AC